MRIRDWSSDVCSSDLMSRSTVCDPNDLVTPRSEMTASSGTPPPGGATWWNDGWPWVGAPPSLVRRPSDALLPTRRDVGHTVPAPPPAQPQLSREPAPLLDRKSTRLNSSH